MQNTQSDRVLVTPSPYAKKNYLYIQETGTLTSLNPHISRRQGLDSYLFFIVLTGQGRFSYNHQPYSLKQGDCVWIDCRLPYSHESSGRFPWELKWVHFSGAGADRFYSHFCSQELPHVFTPANPAIFNECLSALLQIHKDNPAFRELISHRYLTELITNCFTESSDQPSSSNLLREKLLQIREYLKLNFTEKITLDHLSSRFYISKYYLAREYKKTFGVTPGNELTNLRVSHAKYLLRFEQKTVEEISSLCGYQDTAYFIRVFKNRENMTPLEYRRKW